MSKVIDKQLNEYAALLGWGLSCSMGLSLGYAKINSDRFNAKDDKFKDVVLTKKLDNIQICQVEFLLLLTK